MEEVGFPKGTINLILGAGSEVGDVMSGHKEVDLVSFTGGIETGKHIMKMLLIMLRILPWNLAVKIQTLSLMMLILNWR